MPKVVLKRSRELVNMTSNYVIYVDGKKKAQLANGKKVELTLKPGEHILEARVDNYTSEPVKLDISKGEKLSLKIRSFRFNTWILPLIMVLIPSFYFVKNEYEISSLLGLIFIVPVVVYAFYYHTIGRNKYLRFTR